MGAIENPVVFEGGMRLDFLDELQEVPGGERIKHCIQCGTCSGSCPLSQYMEETPRRIFGYVRAGMRDKVLESQAIWTCASCYQCTVRCPSKIRITDVMYALKRLAMKENRRRSRKMQLFSREFVDVVRATGRNHETSLMARFLLKRNPFTAVMAAPIGLALLTKGRLPLMAGGSIKGIDSLRRIMAKAEELGGEA